MHLKKPAVLVAEVPGVIPVVETAWAGHFELTFCTTMQEGESRIRQPFDVIVCGSHFDESRMFDLLRLAKALPQSREIPFLCVRVLDGELDNTAFQGISIAAKALGAAGFVDLNRWRRECGFDVAREKLRDLVYQLAESDPRHL
jgi:CheY-like chemotaxis protein